MGQGVYRDPEFEDNGHAVQMEGWADRISTDKMLEHLKAQVAGEDKASPFCSVLAFKSCHGGWNAEPRDTWRQGPGSPGGG